MRPNPWRLPISQVALEVEKVRKKGTDCNAPLALAAGSLLGGYRRFHDFCQEDIYEVGSLCRQRATEQGHGHRAGAIDCSGR
jgi:hypothetical protein